MLRKDQINNQISILLSQINDEHLSTALKDNETFNLLKDYISKGWISFVPSQLEEATINETKIQNDYIFNKDYFTFQFSNLIKTEEKSNEMLMEDLIKNKTVTTRHSAIDIAAGEGRITKKLLTKYYDHIDLLEPGDDLAKILENLKKDNSKVHSIYHKKVEDFTFEEQYDLIWSGWFLCHLHDLDVVKYIINARNALTEHGVIILKENTSKKHGRSLGIVEYEDDQKIRPLEVFDLFCKMAGLEIVYQNPSKDYPKDLFPLYDIVATKKIEKN